MSAKPTDKKEYKKCKYRLCGKVISPGKSRKRAYCNSAHKQAEFRLRKAESALAVTAHEE